MSKTYRVVFLILAAAVVLALAGWAAQQAATTQKENTEEMVVCPVSGETMKKSEAPVSWEYKGKTYYFCCQNCKDRFMKDPESFLANPPKAKPMGGMMMHQGQMQGQKMMGAQAGNCGMMVEGSPMMNKDVEIKVENTKDGAVVTFSSKKPEVVKMIQDHMAKMKEMRTKMMSEGMAKEQPKEPVKK